MLKRDGKDVQVNNACSATSGTWTSPYDDKVWTSKSDLQIDHMVPLKNAWNVRLSLFFFFSFYVKIEVKLMMVAERSSKLDSVAEARLRQRYHAPAAVGCH